jgi:hypothetical protein
VRRTLLVEGAVIVVLAGAVGALFAFGGGSTTTNCFALFSSPAAADAAARAGDDGGFSVSVDHREKVSAVIFRTGETGDDAEEARRDFRGIVRQHGGELGHPDGGCLEGGLGD